MHVCTYMHTHTHTYFPDYSKHVPANCTKLSCIIASQDSLKQLLSSSHLRVWSWCDVVGWVILLAPWGVFPHWTLAPPLSVPEATCPHNVIWCQGAALCIHKVYCKSKPWNYAESWMVQWQWRANTLTGILETKFPEKWKALNFSLRDKE